MYNLLMMMYCEWLRIKIDRGHAFLSDGSASRTTQLIPSLEASKQVQPQRHKSGGLERLGAVKKRSIYWATHTSTIVAEGSNI
jgi:hypothetical protein